MSADPFLTLGLKALPYAADNYERVYYPLRNRIKRVRSVDHKSFDNMTLYGGSRPDDRGLVLKKRSEVQSDEEIVDVLPKPSSRRGQLVRRTSSVDRGDYGPDNPDRRLGPWRGAAAGVDASDSDASMRPKSRASRSRGRAKSKAGRSTRSSSTSSSDLGSSGDDEKKCRKAARKKWITASLAGVATVHAAAKVYSSIENHDKRAMQVRRGEMSPEEADKKKKQARWQDAAAVAIAALGIKGAMSEWSEVQEQQREHKELMEHRQEMHRRRLEREQRHRTRDVGSAHPSQASSHSRTASNASGRRRRHSRDSEESDGGYYERSR